jgi:hypothetical protein
MTGFDQIRIPLQHGSGFETTLHGVYNSLILQLEMFIFLLRRSTLQVPRLGGVAVKCCSVPTSSEITMVSGLPNSSCHNNLLSQFLFLISVADPGSGAFSTPGFGDGKNIRIRDEHPRSFFRELRNSY